MILYSTQPRLVEVSKEHIQQSEYQMSGQGLVELFRHVPVKDRKYEQPIEEERWGDPDDRMQKHIKILFEHIPGIVIGFFPH